MVYLPEQNSYVGHCVVHLHVRWLRGHGNWCIPQVTRECIMIANSTYQGQSLKKIGLSLSYINFLITLLVKIGV